MCVYAQNCEDIIVIIIIIIIIIITISGLVLYKFDLSSYFEFEVTAYWHRSHKLLIPLIAHHMLNMQRVMYRKCSNLASPPKNIFSHVMQN